MLNRFFIMITISLSLLALSSCDMVNSSAAQATQDTYNYGVEQATQGIVDDIQGK